MKFARSVIKNWIFSWINQTWLNFYPDLSIPLSLDTWLSWCAEINGKTLQLYPRRPDKRNFHRIKSFLTNFKIDSVKQDKQNKKNSILRKLCPWFFKLLPGYLNIWIEISGNLEIERERWKWEISIFLPHLIFNYLKIINK